MYEPTNYSTKPSLPQTALSAQTEAFIANPKLGTIPVLLDAFNGSLQLLELSILQLVAKLDYVLAEPKEHQQAEPFLELEASHMSNASQRILHATSVIEVLNAIVKDADNRLEF
jgi:hypothetical protein